MKGDEERNLTNTGMTNQRKIIVAPLNWGLGHASRCVPIIKELLKNKLTPIIASDGNALEFLKKEFPTLEVLELPSYQISYGKNLKWNLFLKTFSILKVVKKERQILKEYLHQNPDVVGVISDNRFGMYSKEIPSVYITHQINVLSGVFTSMTSFFHQRVIKKFDECWIPDEEGSLFSGKLSKSKKQLNQKYIGVLSRFKKQNKEIEIDVLIVLSGPEPNRTTLENRLKNIFSSTSKNVWLVQGKIEEHQTITETENVKVVNFMLSEELENTLNISKIVICRSGYSSILDLVRLNKKAILIPTNHQNEQEYLSKYLQEKSYFKSIKEKEIDEKLLELLNDSFEIEYEKKYLDSRLFDLFRA